MRKMKNWTIEVAILVIFLSTLACGVQIKTTPVAYPATQASKQATKIVTKTPEWSTYVTVGSTKVRECDSTSCPQIGLLKEKQAVLAHCRADSAWCQLKDGGYAWAACLGYGERKCEGK